MPGYADDRITYKNAYHRLQDENRELLAALEAVLQVDCDADDWHKDPAWAQASAVIAKAKQ